MCKAVIVAPGKGAPSLSTTIPVIAPVVALWAKTVSPSFLKFFIFINIIFIHNNY
jgi:hypothetical protein